MKGEKGSSGSTGSTGLTGPKGAQDRKVWKEIRKREMEGLCM